MESLFQRMTWYESYRVGGYLHAQIALQGAAEKTKIASLPVVLVDLSKLIPKRRDVDPVVGDPKDDEELATQWVGLADIVRNLTQMEPKAMVIDWELGLPDEYVKPTAGGFAYSDRVSKEAREEYDELMRALIEANNPKTKTYFVADNVSSRLAKMSSVFPNDQLVKMAVRSEVPGDSIGPYRSFAYHSNPKTGQLPYLVDAVITGLSEPDALDRPSRYLLFDAYRKTKQGSPKEYWVNYAFLPQLEKFAIRANAIELFTYSSSLKDKIVILADVSKPAADDSFKLPLGNPQDGNDRFSGGLQHASALLTRTVNPVFAPKGHLAELVICFGLSFFVLMAGSVIGAFAIRASKVAEHSDRGELIRVPIELLIQTASIVGVIYFSSRVAEHHILWSEAPSVAISRYADGVWTAVLICFYLAKSKKTIHPRNETR